MTKTYLHFSGILKDSDNQIYLSYIPTKNFWTLPQNPISSEDKLKYEALEFIKLLSNNKNIRYLDENPIASIESEPFTPRGADFRENTLMHYFLFELENKDPYQAQQEDIQGDWFSLNEAIEKLKTNNLNGEEQIKIISNLNKWLKSEVLLQIAPIKDRGY